MRFGLQGAREKIARAIPLLSASHKSAIIPPDVVRGEDAKQPPKNRKTRIEAVFLERAHPTWNPI